MTFAFPDDVYDFDVEAISSRSDKANASYANVTIDTVVPTVEITNIAPTITPTTAEANEDEADFVNGKVTVDFAATDDNGLGTEADGKRHLKYYVAQTQHTGSTDELYEDELYEKGSLVDTPLTSGPVTIGSGNAKRLTINTALYNDKEPLYIYLIARDKAGNTGYVEKKVNIDQSTDLPVFTFTNEQVTDFAQFAVRGEIPYQTPSVLSSANARIGGTVEDDDALAAAITSTGGGLLFSIWKEEKGKSPASADKYTYTTGLIGAKSAKFDLSLDDIGKAKNGAEEEIGGGTEANHLSLPEGGYYFTLEMSDLASAKSGLDAVTGRTEIYYVAVDLKDPEINITVPLDNAFVDPAVPFIIEGNLVEANIETLKISLPHAVGAEPASYVNVTLGEGGGWTVNSDELKVGELEVIDETRRQVTLQAKDRFGRTTEKLLTMRVDREAPVVDAIKFPVENKVQNGVEDVSSVMSADLSINGTAVDGPAGSASGVGQVFYQITDSETPPSKPADYNQLEGKELDGWTLANGGEQWNDSLTLNSTQQGTRYLHVFARDAVHNAGEIKFTRFEVDTENPEIGDIAWENIIQSGITHYAKDGFTLKFSAFDSNALNPTDSPSPISITRKMNGGESVTLKPVLVKSGYYKGDFADVRYGSHSVYNETKLWGVTLTEEVGSGAGQLDNGTYEYTLLVRDAANKTVTQTVTVTVDNSPPEIDVTGVTPTVAESGDTYTVNGIVRLNFNVSDNEGIGEDNNDGYAKRQIKYLVSTDGTLTDAAAVYNNEDAVFVDALVSALNLNYNDGKSNSVKVKSTEPKSLYIDTRKLTDKTNTYLYIAAQDRAGNTSVFKTTFSVDQDTDAPSITFTDIDTTISSISDLLAHTPTNLFGADVKIRGTFTDDDAIDTANVELVIWKEGEETSKKESIVSGLTGAGTVNFNITSQTLGGIISGGTPVDLPEGVYFFTLKVSDSTSGDFAVTPAKTTTMGPYCFAVDTDDPKISVLTPTRGSYQSSTFTLTGTISDHSNKNKSQAPHLTIKDPKHTSAEVISLAESAYNEETGEWAWTYTADGIDAVNNTVRIVANDRFNKERIDDFKVEFDDIAPRVTIKQPVLNNWFEGVTTSFGGSLSDNSDKVLQKVYYYIMKPGVVAPPAIPASPLDTAKEEAAIQSDWGEAVISGGSWSAAVDLSDDTVAKEGANVLYVIGYDVAGNGPDRDGTHWSNDKPVWSTSWAGDIPTNNTAAAMLTFNVDRSAPDASGLKFYKTTDSEHTAALADKSFIKETFTLFGVVTDSNELDTLVVKQNGEEITLTETELVKTSGKSWAVNLALPRLTAPLTNAEGIYVYTIEVADKSQGLNHKATLNQTVTVDTSGPTVVVTSPAEAEPFNTASITVTGSVDDTLNGGGAGAGVSKVYFRVGTMGYEVPASGADGWTEANGTSQWSKTGVNIGSIEGELMFTAFAEDVLGNRGEAVVHNFYVDASNPEILDDAYNGEISLDKYAKGAFIIKFTAFDSNILNTDDINGDGKLAGVVVRRINGGDSAEVFNSHTVSGGFAALNDSNTYTDAHGNTLTVSGTYTGTLNGRTPTINSYSKEKVWGVTLAQNDAAKEGDTTSGRLENGIYDYVITVTDAGGRSASKTVTVTIDAEKPSIDVTRFTALVNRDLGAGISDYVNGVIQFAVSASDENGLATTHPLQYWVLPQGVSFTAPSTTAGWETAGGVFFERGVQPLIDTVNGSDTGQTPQSFVDNTAYVLYIGAMDKAGNIGVTAYNTDDHADYSFIINQETDKPLVTITSPDADAHVGGSHLVQGVLTDDDGFKAGTDNSERISIEYSYNGTSDWSAVNGTITTTKITDFEYNFTYAVADIGDRHIWVRVTAKDDEARKLAMVGQPAAQATAEKTINFTIDSKPPVIEVEAGGDTFKDDFTLTGHFTERNYKAGSLAVSINGEAKGAITPTQAGDFTTTDKWDWTYAVNLSDLKDGVNTIELEVYDQRDQVGRISAVVNKDTTAPTAAISEFKNFVTLTNTENGVSVYAVNGVVKWTAITSDNLGVKETRYWLLPKTADTNAETTRVAGLKTAMGAEADSAVNGTAFTGGEVFIDTVNGKDNQAGQVAITDEAEYTLYVGVSDKAGNVFIYTYLPNETADYSFKVDQATDRPTWTFDNLDAVDATKNFIAGGTVLKGTVVDDDGFANKDSLVVEFASDTDGSPGTWGTTGFTPELKAVGTREIQWSTSLPTGIADGVHYLRLKATDDGTKKVGADEAGIPFTSAPVKFTLDKTPPKPVIATVGETDGAVAGTVKSAPSIKGTLDETNPSSLTLTVKNSAGVIVAEGKFDEAQLTENGTSTGTWEWTWTPPTDGDTFDDLPDGLYTVAVDAIDKVTYSGTVQTVFNKDVKGPTVTFSNLTQEVVLSRELMLEVADNNDSYTGWTAHGLTGTPSNADIHAEAVKVYAKSRALITGAQTETTDAVIKDIIRNTDANLRGTFADDYSNIKRFEYRFDTDPYDADYPNDTSKTLWRAGGELGSVKNTNWVIPIPAKDAETSSTPYNGSSTYPVEDGVRRVSIRVYDALDNMSEKADIAFYLDREGPVFDLTKFAGSASGNDAGGTIYSLVGITNDTDTVFTFKGSVSDANIDKLTVSGVTGVSLVPSNETEGGKDFTITVTKAQFAALADGSYTFTFSATDVAGNSAQNDADNKPITWTFVKDTTPPENNFLNMGDDLTSNTDGAPFLFGDASAKIMGSTSDATSGLKSLTYTLEEYKTTEDVTDWTSVKTNEALSTASSTWNIVLGSGGLGLFGGRYRISVTAEDNAQKAGGGASSNKTVNGMSDTGTAFPEWIYFVLDIEPPTLSVDEIGQYYNRDVPLKGTASDDNGIEKIEVSFTSLSTSKETLTVAGNEEGANKIGNNGEWSITMPVAELGEGSQTINITAYDKAGHTATRQLNFILDKTPPSVAMQYPNKLGERVIGALTMNGLSDDGSAVAKVFYQIGKSETIETTTIVKDQAYIIKTEGTFDWTSVGAPTGAVKGTAFIATENKTVDNGGNATAWKDTILDTQSSTVIKEGAPKITWSNGIHSWRLDFDELKYLVNSGGNATYDGNMNGIYGTKRYRYKTSDDDTLIEYAGEDANDNNLTIGAPENNVWDVPVNVLVFDKAGNAAPYEFYITVDPYMDKPTSAILSPDGSQAVGGVVRLTGIASDNNRVNSVWVRVSGATHTDNDIYVDGDKAKGYANWNFSEWTLDTANSATDKWYDWDTNWLNSPNANTTYAKPAETEPTEEPTETEGTTDVLYTSMGVGWHQANLQSPGSGLVNWNISLNANGKLNQGDSRDIYIEVFARDTKSGAYGTEEGSVNGYTTRHILTFSNEVPLIADVKITPADGTVLDYTYQMQISKTVTIKTNIKDYRGIDVMTVQPTGRTSPVSILSAGEHIIDQLKVTVKDANGPENEDTGKRDYYGYDIEMELDCASLFVNTTGIYGLTLVVTNTREPALTSNFAMSFQIDNSFPRTTYTALPTAVGDYTLRGTANDAPPSGSIQGLKSVIVYFSRTVSGTTTYYMPKGSVEGAVITHSASTEMSAQTTVSVREWNGTVLAADSKDIVYPAAGYGILIDKDESASGEIDGDGFVEAWYDNVGSEKIWSATFDSTRIPDGKITVHYVAEDNAGNKTHSEQAVYFQNHAPSITSLTLGTPLFGTDITGTKDVSDKPLDTQFTVRNDKFQIGLAVSGGNGQRHYRVRYLTRSDTPVTTITQNEIYTVAQTNPGFDFKNIGAKDNVFGAPFVATRSTSDLYGASVFAYTSVDTLIKSTQLGSTTDATVTANIDFSSDDFGSGKIADSGAYAVVKAGGTLLKGQKYRIEEMGNTPWASLAGIVGLVNAEKGSTFIPLNDVTLTAGTTGVAVTSNDRYFSIKVWDSTLSGTSDDELEQLSDFALVAVRVENEDTRPPITQLYDLNPKAESTITASVNPVVMVGTTATVQNTTKGSLYMDGKMISGHIEPRDGVGNGIGIVESKANIWLEHDLNEDGSEKTPVVIKPTGFAKDTVSGVVTLRGRAQDDQRITAIYLAFGNGTPLKILEENTDGKLKPAGSLEENKDVGLYQDLSIDGHVVEWTYRWDSGTVINNVTTDTLGNVTVTVRAEDKSAPNGNNGAVASTSDTKGISETKANGTDNTDYNSIGLDLAPYITTLTRFKDSTGTDKAPVLRSKNGWFSFRRGNGDVERMQIEGFNLGSSDQTVTIDGTSGGTVTSNVINIPNNATSGIVKYTAGTGEVEAVNNKNNNANSWNTSQEALAGNEASALWNDDRAVHLFDSHNIETGDNQGHFRSPSVVGSLVKPGMTINPTNGELWASWSSYLINSTAYNAQGGGTGGSTMPSYYSTNNGTTVATPMTWSADPPEDTDISWNGTSANMVVLENYMQGDYSMGGLTYLDTSTRTNAANHKGTWIERFNANGNSYLNQFINPRIVNNGTVSHIAYYDAKYQRLRYWRSNNTGTIVLVDGIITAITVVSGASSTNNNNRYYLRYTVADGAIVDIGDTVAEWHNEDNDNANTRQSTVTATVAGRVTPIQAQSFRPGTGQGATSYDLFAITTPANNNPNPIVDAGNYSAIDVNSAGIPVIAYLVQDIAAGTETLRYAYGNAANATSFTSANITTAGISTAGRYVSMRIDTNTTAGRKDVMHITFMDSDNGDLVYIKGTPTGTSGAYTFADPVVIDSVGNVGKWADIAIDAGGNPVISYLDQGGIDSRTGLKMAFYDTANGDNGWEYVTLPGRYVVNDVRTQVECDTRDARTWNAALAYVSGNYYRISYYVK